MLANITNYDQRVEAGKRLEKKIIDALAAYSGEDRDDLKEMCIEKRKAGEFTLEFARHIGKQIGVEI